MRKSTIAVIAAALAVIAVAAQAVTYIVPSDRELIQNAPAIVVAHAVAVHCEMIPSGSVVTITDFAVDETLKGAIDNGATVSVIDPGGVVGGFAAVIPGAPRYDVGQPYLLFLGIRGDGWNTFAMGLGKFRFVTDLTGRKFALRDDDATFGFDSTDWTPHVENLRAAAPFLDYIRNVAGGNTAAAQDYLVPQSDLMLATLSETLTRKLIPAPNYTISDYLSSSPLRWKTPTATIVYCCTTTNGSGSTLSGTTALNFAFSKWNGAGAGVNYINGGLNANATGGLIGVTPRTHRDGYNAVLFGDPYGDLPGPSGGNYILGIGGGTGWSYVGPDGGTYYGPDIPGSPAGEVDVEMNDGIDVFGQAVFNVAVTHELGHTLGFRHSDKSRDDSAACSAPLPCSSSAIMTAFTSTAFTGLQPWDAAAVTTVYGSGPTCTNPTINTQPQNATITSGNSTTLSVSATGTSLTYQWYIGSSGDTSQPVNGATGASVQVSPSSTTSYWVQVTSGTCTTNSSAATVTVNQGCVAPSISTQPASTSIANGQSTSLFVGASGSGPFTYQWYIGTTGDTSQPINSGTTAVLMASPTVTTQYWVRVNNSCGPPVNSSTATVTVTAGCTQPTITLDAQDQTVTAGSTAVLYFGYTGTAGSITWYQGSYPDASLAVASTQQAVVGPLNATTHYWAQVQNSCGTAHTRTMTVTVTITCVQPAITSVDGSPKTLTPGQSTTLTVQATGSSLAFQWYKGTPGDTAHSTAVAGATSATLTDTPAATTTYWVQVTNSCGTASSGGVTVTVGSQCATPTITSQSPDETISSNQTATLSVAASGGASFHYAWYRGFPGDKSNPLGSDAPTFTTPALQHTTTFWVQVTNDCQSTVNSNAINVNVVPAKHRASRH